MIRMCELRQKEVINIKDGSRFGFIDDVIIDLERGAVVKIIVPGPGRVFGFFGKEQEFQISWSAITQIGEDIILVNVDTTKILRNTDYL